MKTASASDSFADVAKMMRTHGISSVVVLDGKKLAGHRHGARHREPGGRGRRPEHHHRRAGHDAPRPDHGGSEDRALRSGRADGVEQHPSPADRRRRQRRGDRVDPGHDPMGRRGALRRSRDAGHRRAPTRRFRRRASSSASAAPERDSPSIRRLRRADRPTPARTDLAVCRASRVAPGPEGRAAPPSSPSRSSRAVSTWASRAGGTSGAGTTRGTL